MPITTKKKTTTTTKQGGTRSKTPRISPSDIGIQEFDLLELHGLIEEAKTAKDAVECETKTKLLNEARKRIFGGNPGSFNIELDDGCVLQVKPSSKSYPLNDAQVAAIEEVFEESGHDSGDYYHESHAITIQADTIHERLEAEEEDRYIKFQAAFAEFMTTWGVGDCWQMSEAIIAKPDFHTSRFSLPKRMNLKLEEIKPSTISVSAKREI